MDRISKAVERARQERQKEKVASPPVLEDAAIIQYTKTQSVRLSQALLKKNRILSTDDHDEFSHAFKVLRTRVWQTMKEKGWNSIAVTSCNPNEGKTITSINLALCLTMMKANHSVLLVDLDLRRPSISKYLGLETQYGLGDYLEQGVPLDDILVNPGIGRFVILPGNKKITNSSEIISSVRMEHLVHDFKTRYPSRLVVFDLPPLLATDDVLVFLPYVDAVLLVVEEGRTAIEDLKRAVQILGSEKLLGTVLNKSEEVVTAYY